MLIKLQKPLKIKNVTYKPGDIVDLEETQASLLIKKGFAIEQKQKEDMFTRLYGTDAIPMNTLRERVFNAFISTMSRKHILKPNPDGYLTTCLSCGGNLLINKFTGTTYCFNCKQEQPFEHLFEILKSLDIYSIVQEIKNEKKSNEVVKWKLYLTYPCFHQLLYLFFPVSIFY